MYFLCKDAQHILPNFEETLENPGPGVSSVASHSGGKVQNDIPIIKGFWLMVEPW